MANIAMLVGGERPLLFSSLKSSGVDEEQKRHDKAIEQLQAGMRLGLKADRAPGLDQRGAPPASPRRENIPGCRRGHEALFGGHRENGQL